LLASHASITKERGNRSLRLGHLNRDIETNIRIFRTANWGGIEILSTKFTRTLCHTLAYGVPDHIVAFLTYHRLNIKKYTASTKCRSDKYFSGGTLFQKMANYGAGRLTNIGMLVSVYSANINSFDPKGRTILDWVIKKQKTDKAWIKKHYVKAEKYLRRISAKRALQLRNR